MNIWIALIVIVCAWEYPLYTEHLILLPDICALPIIKSFKELTIHAISVSCDVENPLTLNTTVLLPGISIPGNNLISYLIKLLFTEDESLLNII